MSPSTPPLPLPEDDKHEAMEKKTCQVEPEKEKKAVESNEPSIVASSIANGVEKPEISEDGDDGPATEEKGVDEPQNPVEYPRGIEMFFIMLALVLSITLCSLDQVSSTAPTTHASTDRLDSDHCCNRYSKDYRPVRQNSGYLVVRLGLLPDARSVPVTVGQSV